MINRPFWIKRVKQAWQKQPIVWLSGVRRVGKTTLAGMFPNSVYLNCDLPSVTRRLEDPESFFDSLKKGSTVIFDEVHRMDRPSQLLKIAADTYPHLKILATGSSTLAATKKFRDSLAGRKRMIYLAPVLWDECQEQFSIRNLDHRLLHGGLPEPLLASEKDVSFFAEWIDSFYARDIQELFAIRSRTGFMKLLHLLIRQSGGLIDYTHLAKLSDLSRPTVKAHVEAICIAHAAVLIPPFHGRGRREITRRQKCYAFDTGFVTYVRGWESIREEDRGILWEHLVIDMLRAREIDNNIYFWRDKSGREVNFIIKRSGNNVDAFECKINPDSINIQALKAFRELHPNGKNYLICPNIRESYQIRHGELFVEYKSLK